MFESEHATRPAVPTSTVRLHRVRHVWSWTLCVRLLDLVLSSSRASCGGERGGREGVHGLSLARRLRGRGAQIGGGASRPPAKGAGGDGGAEGERMKGDGSWGPKWVGREGRAGRREGRGRERGAQMGGGAARRTGCGGGTERERARGTRAPAWEAGIQLPETGRPLDMMSQLELQWVVWSTPTSGASYSWRA